MMERKKSKKEEAKEKKEIKKRDEKYEKQTKTAVIIMIILIFSIFAIHWISQERNKFEYAGLEFQKIMFDKLPLYHAKIPIRSPTGNLIANYNLYFRNDPRELEEIPIEGSIMLKKDVVITADENIVCADEAIAGGSLSGFLEGAGLNIYAGTTDRNKASKELMYVDCNSKKYTVVKIEQADETKIVQEEQDCYKIAIRDCEIIKGVERFMIGVLENSRINI